MLAGRYPSDAFAELKPRLVWDRETDLLTARPGAHRIAVINGGTIPDRGLYGVFLAGGDGPGRRVGELDEEMVYESRVGDVFALGSTSWQIVDITHDRVLVTPAPGRAGKLPFWHGDTDRTPARARRSRSVPRASAARSAHADARAAAGGRRPRRQRATDNALAYLDEQQRPCGHVPDDRTIVVERFRDEIGDWRLVVHSFLGGRVNTPWAMAIAARLRDDLDIDVQVMPSDDGIVLRLPDLGDDDQCPDVVEHLLIDPDDVERLVTDAVWGSALFAARFRECAARALLLPRRRPDRRTPLWQQRQRSAQLLGVATGHPTFPIVLETMRECLQDVFDVPGPAGAAVRPRLRTRCGSSRSRRHGRRRSPARCSSRTSAPFSTRVTRRWPSGARRPSPSTPRCSPSCSGRPSCASCSTPRRSPPSNVASAGCTDERRLRDAEAVADALRVLGPLSDADLLERGGELALGRAARRAAAGRPAPTACRASAGSPSRTSHGCATPSGSRCPPASPAPSPRRSPTRSATSSAVRPHPRSVHHRRGRGGASGSGPPSSPAPSSGSRRKGGSCAAPSARTAAAASGATRRPASDPPGQPGARPASVEPVPAERLCRVPAAVAGGHGGVAARRRRGARASSTSSPARAAPASEWERSILPARVVDYRPELLDELTASGDVLWYGAGALPRGDGWLGFVPVDQRIGVAARPAPVADDHTARTSRCSTCCSDGTALLTRQVEQALPGSGLGADVVDAALWDLVWAGTLTNDTLAAVRARVAASGRPTSRRARPPSGRYPNRPRPGFGGRAVAPRTADADAGPLDPPARAPGVAHGARARHCRGAAAHGTASSRVARWPRRACREGSPPCTGCSPRWRRPAGSGAATSSRVWAPPSSRPVTRWTGCAPSTTRLRPWCWPPPIRPTPSAQRSPGPPRPARTAPAGPQARAWSSTGRASCCTSNAVGRSLLSWAPASDPPGRRGSLRRGRRRAQRPASGRHAREGRRRAGARHRLARPARRCRVRHHPSRPAAPTPTLTEARRVRSSVDARSRRVRSRWTSVRLGCHRDDAVTAKETSHRVLASASREGTGPRRHLLGRPCGSWTAAFARPITTAGS